MATSAPPIWPTRASTVSPGASCRSRNSSTRISTSVGRLAARRLKARKRTRIRVLLGRRSPSGLDPGVVPVARVPARRVVMVLHALTRGGDELVLREHPDRQVLVHELHPLG